MGKYIGKQHNVVSILVALFEPNLVWLEQLLWSIRRQTYQNYEMLFMDDGSRQVKYAEIENTIRKVFGKRAGVVLKRSVHNQGSNKTFEKLAVLAEGEYLAFCDQDDIWEVDKLQRLVNEIRQKDAVLAYSDMSVIDEYGRMVYPGLRHMRINLKYVSGRDLTAKYIMDNCTAACSMLVRKDAVLRAVPFYEGTYCDQWICASAAADGTIAFVDLPLVRYRRHGGNQTGTLRHIDSRQNYYNRRILSACSMVLELKKRGIHYKYEAEIEAFVSARKRKDILGIWKYRKCSRKYAYFDILILCLPDRLVKRMLKILQK